MEGYDEGKWPKRHRTRRLGPMVSVFFFPFVFINTNACLLHTQLLIYMLRSMETRNGPNDTGHVVWALW